MLHARLRSATKYHPMHLLRHARSLRARASAAPCQQPRAPTARARLLHRALPAPLPLHGNALAVPSACCHQRCGALRNKNSCASAPSTRTPNESPCAPCARYLPRSMELEPLCTRACHLCTWLHELTATHSRILLDLQRWVTQKSAHDCAAASIHAIAQYATHDQQERKARRGNGPSLALACWTVRSQ